MCGCLPPSGGFGIIVGVVCVQGILSAACAFGVQWLYCMPPTSLKVLTLEEISFSPSWLVLKVLTQLFEVKIQNAEPWLKSVGVDEIEQLRMASDMTLLCMGIAAFMGFVAVGVAAVAAFAPELDNRTGWVKAAAGVLLIGDGLFLVISFILYGFVVASVLEQVDVASFIKDASKTLGFDISAASSLLIHFNSKCQYVEKGLGIGLLAFQIVLVIGGGFAAIFGVGEKKARAFHHFDMGGRNASVQMQQWGGRGPMPPHGMPPHGMPPQYG
eukprot:TRINITY_DN32485_c0_g1_i1.p1 TRINITY_DN32485_c0_g1~~TRINITY_DN32485_c0_g1_i1.p1  ORF type:complete len:293 (-),score=39.11 TRINITY_DN32485_c0_g1_i1:62-874(-)